MSKKHKVFGVITLLLCLAYILLDAILKYNHLGMRRIPHNIAVLTFLIPLMLFLMWTALVFIKKSKKMGRVLKFMARGLVGFVLFGFIGIIGMVTLGYEEHVEVVDGVSYVAQVTTIYDQKSLTTFYYEVENEYLYKIPYSYRIEPKHN